MEKISKEINISLIRDEKKELITITWIDWKVSWWYLQVFIAKITFKRIHKWIKNSLNLIIFKKTNQHI